MVLTLWDNIPDSTITPLWYLVAAYEQNQASTHFQLYPGQTFQMIIRRIGLGFGGREGRFNNTFL